MIDIIAELDEVRHRAHAGEQGDQIAVPERLARWFPPVTGDLRVGGKFATEGNADGEILGCDRPSRLVLACGAPESVVTVGLAVADAGSTVLTLEHSVTATPVPDAGGALDVGPGWDDALLALALHLRGTDLGDPVAFQHSPEYNQGAAQAWEAALRESGMATEERTAAAVEVATAQCTTLPDPGTES